MVQPAELLVYSASVLRVAATGAPTALLLLVVVVVVVVV
jgi:hypothetical protein